MSLIEKHCVVCKKGTAPLSVEQALGWIDRMAPKRAILTNLHSDLDYDELRSKLPSHVVPAYDGMQISL